MEGNGQEFLRRNGVVLIVNKSPKCCTWVQSQKQQNDLGSLPGKNIQHYNISRSMPPPLMLKKLKLICSMKTYKTSRTNTKKRCPFHHRGLE